MFYQVFVNINSTIEILEASQVSIDMQFCLTKYNDKRSQFQESLNQQNILESEKSYLKMRLDLLDCSFQICSNLHKLHIKNNALLADIDDLEENYKTILITSSYDRIKKLQMVSDLVNQDDEILSISKNNLEQTEKNIEESYNSIMRYFNDLPKENNNIVKLQAYAINYIKLSSCMFNNKHKVFLESLSNINKDLQSTVAIKYQVLISRKMKQEDINNYVSNLFKIFNAQKKNLIAQENNLQIIFNNAKNYADGDIIEFTKLENKYNSMHENTNIVCDNMTYTY
jgi:hypothetical protein